MANVAKALPANVPGNWFVDSTCIDCDTCRQLAPGVFGEADGFSYVQQQPPDAGEERAAARALVACPTGSIGTRGASPAKAALDDFPLLIDGGVYYCGFTSPKAFGGSSYFVRRAGGNWLIDSPKFRMGPSRSRRPRASAGERDAAGDGGARAADRQVTARNWRPAILLIQQRAVCDSWDEALLRPTLRKHQEPLHVHQWLIESQVSDGTRWRRTGGVYRPGACDGGGAR